MPGVNRYLDKLNQNPNLKQYFLVALKGGFKHDTPGYFREDLARLAVKTAIEHGKALAREAKALTRELLEAEKEEARQERAAEKAASALRSIKKAKPAKKTGPILGKIIFKKNGALSYKKLH